MRHKAYGIDPVDSNSQMCVPETSVALTCANGRAGAGVLTFAWYIGKNFPTKDTSITISNSDGHPPAICIPKGGFRHA